MIRDYCGLTAYLAAREHMPFVWGRNENDCISFAAGALAAQTGIDPLADLAWASEAEAEALIDKLGGLITAIGARLEQIAPAHALRGDIGAVMYGNQVGIMVVEGATLVGPGLRRAARRPRTDMMLAWRPR